MPASLAKHKKDPGTFGRKRLELSTGKVRPLTLIGTQHKNEARQHAS